MKTIEDIMKNPYMSLIRMKEDRNELLQFGPYLIAHESFEGSRKDLSYSNFPLLRYLLDMMALLRMEANETATFKEKKTFLLQLMKDTSFFMLDADVYDGGMTNWCATRANQYAESALNKLRNIQYKDACVESAMTGYAPIVPYGIPMMKLPLKNKKSEDLEDRIEYTIKNREALEALFDVPISHMDEAQLSEKAFRLLIDHAPSILSHTEYTIDPSGLIMPENASNPATFTLPTWTVGLLSNEDEIPSTNFYAMAYYLIAFIFYAKMNLSIECHCENIDRLIQKAIEVSDGAVPTFESLLEISNLFSTPESIEDVFPTPAKLSKKFVEDKEKEETITPVDKRNEAEQEKEFNADTLLGYIYTHRQYKHDKYTNQAFVTQYDMLEDCSYMQDDIMLCVIKEKYLCSPAIDLAGTNNYEVVLICLDKDDNIFVVKSPEDLN